MLEKDGSHNQGLFAHLHILHLVEKGLILREFGPFLDIWGDFNTSDRTPSLPAAAGKWDGSKSMKTPWLHLPWLEIDYLCLSQLLMLGWHSRHICHIIFIIAHFPLIKGESHALHGEESASLLKMPEIHKHLHRGLHSNRNYMKGLLL